MMASLAKQLHAELDGQRRMVEQSLGDLAAQFHTLRSVEVEALQKDVSNLQRNAVTNKAHLQVVERCMALEAQVRSLTTLHGFSSTKLANHLEYFADLKARWTCQHGCATESLAFARCAEIKCGKPICAECSHAGRNGHIALVDGFGGMGGGAGGGGLHLPNSSSILTVVENSSLLRDVQSRLSSQSDSAANTRKVVDTLASQLGALLSLLGKMHLVVANIDPALLAPGMASEEMLKDATTPFKLGPSATLLLDSRAVAYFDSLGTLLQQGWPELLSRMLTAEERYSGLSSSVDRLERRAREVELASRPFVEERVAMLSAKLLLLEKGVLKKLRAEVRRVEAESKEKAAREKEAAAANVGMETSLARVHYRCLACDQVVNAQPGPLSKELLAQLAHQHGHAAGGAAHHTTVAGFASALPAANSSQLALPAGSDPGQANVVSSERGHLFVDPGTRITLHATSGSEVYRGREDVRVSFTPAAPAPSEPGHVKSASFHAAYSKESVVPAGSLGRSAGGRSATAAGRHHVSASDGVNLPRLNLSQTQPAGSASASARSASAVPKVPQHPPGSQTQRSAAAAGRTTRGAVAEGERKEE